VTSQNKKYSKTHKATQKDKRTLIYRPDITVYTGLDGHGRPKIIEVKTEFFSKPDFWGSFQWSDNGSLTTAPDHNA
jgi:hypothetical protein